MFTKKKILIIGKGSDILKTFNYLFRNNQVTNLSFRKAWNKPCIVKYYDIILLSGFHFYICKMKHNDLLKYIKNYYQFILTIKKKSNKFYLISTDLSVKISVSRVVYFYHLLNKKISIFKNVSVISFDTIAGHETNISTGLKIKLLKFLKINTFFYKNMYKKFSNVKKNNQSKKIKFFFIKFTRTRTTDRIIRLIFDLFLFKFYKIKLNKKDLS